MRYVLLLSMILMTFSTVYAGPVITPEVKQIMEEAKKQVKGITPEALKPLIEEDKVVLIDVCNPNEWVGGTIEAERLVKLSRGMLEFKYKPLLVDIYGKDEHYIVYCGLGARALLSAQKLQELGFTNVQYIIGGKKAYDAYIATEK